jgi:lipopolysaccharide transport system permease protein
MSVETLANPPIVLPDVPETEYPLQVIEPQKGWIGINWAEIWQYRELLYFLTWRDVKVRYKQTALGAAWAILQPVMQMLLFSVIFGRLAGLDQKTGGVPYPIYVYAALLPWTFFANAINSSGNSLVGNANLISKVYFPRLVVPLAGVCAGLVDFAVASVVLVALMLFYGVALPWQLALLPVFVLGAVLIATGVGILLSALTVAYRDFRYVVPFMIQVWLYATPVMYPPTIFPERWRWVLAVNPMTGIIEGFRAVFLGRPLDVAPTALSLAVGVLLFFAGTAYFRSVERRFADII